MDSSNLPRLRQIAREIRSAPESFAGFGPEATSRITDFVASALQEAIRLGAFAGPDHDKLRALIRNQENYGYSGWRLFSGIFAEAVTCLCPDLKEPGPKVMAGARACAPIADALEEDIAAAARSGGGKAKKDVMNLRARDALKGRPPKGCKRWTTRTLGNAIGCSGSYVRSLPAWRAYYAKHGPKQEGAPKAVAFTSEVEATVGKPDAALMALIAEQAADDEGSPLDSTRRGKRPRRPKA